MSYWKAKPKYLAAWKLPSLSWLWGLVVLMTSIGSVVSAQLPAELLEKLADQQFQVRETAQQDVLGWALANKDEAPRILLSCLVKNTDPEVKFRCMRVLEALARSEYEKQGQGFIGIQMRDEMVRLPDGNDLKAAIRVTFILPGLAAEKAGLKVGDLIVGINGKGWDSPATDGMRQQVMGMRPTTEIKLQALRGDKVEEFDVTLVRRPVTADNPMLERLPGHAEKAEKRLWEQYFEQWKKKHQPGV